ncbi:MAG: L-threonylcarbamoyladenylate synthase [bacterium]|nr:L-threonylcarbamoyladenylate synthase [bacterium]
METEHLAKNNTRWCRRLGRRLRAGEVVIMPTDTVYGLLARADSLTAIRRVYMIKHRDKSYPLLVLVSSLSMVRRYCYLNSKQAKTLQNIWSQARPTTVILQHRGLLPRRLTGDSEGLAVRLPKSDFLRKIVRSVGVPLTATSANLSGQPVLDAALAAQVFAAGSQPDLIVSGGTNVKRPSRLLRLDSSGEVTILRK